MDGSSAEMRENVLYRRRWGATGTLIFNSQKDDALESSKLGSEDSFPTSEVFTYSAANVSACLCRGGLVFSAGD